MTTATKKRKTKSDDPGFTIEGDPVAVVEAAAEAALRSEEAFDDSANDESDEAEDPLPTPSQLARLQKLESIFADLQELEREAQDADRQVIMLKEELKEAKERYEAIVVRMRQKTKQANDPQGELPFPADEQSGDPGQLPGNQAWRVVTLEELEITGKLAERLTEAGLTTLGSLADYTSGGNIFEEIGGIGQKMAEKIDAATADWWQRHPGAAEESSEGDGVEASEAAAPAVDA